MLHFDPLPRVITSQLAVTQREKVAAFDTQNDGNRGVVWISSHESPVNEALACGNREPLGGAHANDSRVIKDGVQQRGRDFGLIYFPRPNGRRLVSRSHRTAGVRAFEFLHAHTMLRRIDGNSTSKMTP